MAGFQECTLTLILMINRKKSLKASRVRIINMFSRYTPDV